MKREDMKKIIKLSEAISAMGEDYISNWVSGETTKYGVFSKKERETFLKIIKKVAEVLKIDLNNMFYDDVVKAKELYGWNDDTWYDEAEE